MMTTFIKSCNALSALQGFGSVVSGLGWDCSKNSWGSISELSLEIAAIIEFFIRF